MHWRSANPKKGRNSFNHQGAPQNDNDLSNLDSKYSWRQIIRTVPDGVLVTARRILPSPEESIWSRTGVKELAHNDHGLVILVIIHSAWNSAEYQDANSMTDLPWDAAQVSGQPALQALLCPPLPLLGVGQAHWPLSWGQHWYHFNNYGRETFWFLNRTLHFGKTYLLADPGRLDP